MSYICVYIVDDDSCVVDLTIILDSSGSIKWKTGNNWILMKKFAQEFVRHFNVNPEETRVAVVE